MSSLFSRFEGQLRMFWFLGIHPLLIQGHLCWPQVFATDAANAAKAAASATNLVANMRAFRFLIITQCGLGPDSIEKIFNFEQRFGDPKVAGLKLDDVKSNYGTGYATELS